PSPGVPRAGGPAPHAGGAGHCRNAATGGPLPTRRPPAPRRTGVRRPTSGVSDARGRGRWERGGARSRPAAEHAVQVVLVPLECSVNAVSRGRALDRSLRGSVAWLHLILASLV